MANVTVIRANTPKANNRNSYQASKLKVAAYARVSTERDEQENSFEAQIKYFKNKIKSNPNWTFVDMYSDEGKTGTNTKKRDGFNKMIADALNGKIDIILVKSISRFGRNTVDTLNACRELKSKGIDVIFEKENINILGNSGELMLTIFSSLAQEESRSISENVTWGWRAKFKSGEFSLPYSHFLGYRKGPDGKPEIVEEEAVIVRLIYKMFIENNSPNQIAKYLNEQGIPSPANSKWSFSTVKSILTNEKYCGDARLQKQYTVDFLEHKKAKNKGEVDQYYITDSHEGIVSHELFDFVQAEMEKRKGRPVSSSNSVFAGMLFCEDCGERYGMKVWHSNDKYRKVIFRCNGKYKNDTKCGTATVNETQLKSAFVRATEQVYGNKEITAACEEILETIGDMTALNEQLFQINLECETYGKEVEKIIQEASLFGGDGKEFEKRYEYLTEKYEKACDEAARVTEEIDKKKIKCTNIRYFYSKIKALDNPIEDFDSSLWYSLVEKALIGKEHITFILRDGSEIKVEME